MPLYIVRWPDLSVSIIRASNKNDLFYKLDEVANPAECKVKLYTGPLHIMLKLDVEYEIDDSGPVERVLVKDVSKCIDQWSFDFGDDDGDSGYAMRKEIVAFAFPYYSQYLEVCGWRDAESENKGFDEETLETLCKETMKKELEYPLETWTLPDDM